MSLPHVRNALAVILLRRHSDGVGGGEGLRGERMGRKKQRREEVEGKGRGGESGKGEKGKEEGRKRN